MLKFRLLKVSSMNSDQITYALRFLSLIAGSTVVVAYIKNSQLNKRAHKKLVSEASKSVLKRVEMYYRIRRRTKSSEDLISIRNIFHQIQEENEYYKTLLMSESKWHGERYQLYITAIQELTRDSLRNAWMKKPFGPAVEIKVDERPDHAKINRLANQFSKDCRRLMSRTMRILMRLRDSGVIRKFWAIKVYDV